MYSVLIERFDSVDLSDSVRMPLERWSTRLFYINDSLYKHVLGHAEINLLFLKQTFFSAYVHI